MYPDDSQGIINYGSKQYVNCWTQWQTDESDYFYVSQRLMKSFSGSVWVSVSLSKHSVLNKYGPAKQCLPLLVILMIWNHLDMYMYQDLIKHFALQLHFKFVFYVMLHEEQVRVVCLIFQRSLKNSKNSSSFGRATSTVHFHIGHTYEWKCGNTKQLKKLNLQFQFCFLRVIGNKRSK